MVTAVMMCRYTATFDGVLLMYICTKYTLKYKKPKITEMTMTTKSTTPLTNAPSSSLRICVPKGKKKVLLTCHRVCGNSDGIGYSIVNRDARGYNGLNTTRIRAVLF